MPIEQRLKQLQSLLDQMCFTRDVMAKFNVTASTVSRWVRNGRLNAVQGPPGIGMIFDSEEVERFVPPKLGRPFPKKK